MEERVRSDSGAADAATYRLEQLHALKCAVDRQWLAAVADFDRDRHWEADAMGSMADWLEYRFAMEGRTAREEVRVAHALAELPRVGSLYGEGGVSRDQVGHLSWFASSEDDARWAQVAPEMPVVEMARRARMERRRLKGAEEDAKRERGSLRYWWAEDRSVFRLTGRLPAPEGAVVQAALERVAAPPQKEEAGAGGALAEEAGVPALVPYEVRCADALVEAMSMRLGADADRDRATVVVHTDVATLAGQGAGEVADAVAITAEQVRRLACDARLQLVVENALGVPVGMGRTTRTVPPHIAREVRRRDVVCVWPGCHRRLWVECHHIHPWQDGGCTDVDNLCLLCGEHHTLVHEGGWSITGDPYAGLTFVRPDGTVLATRPPVLDPAVRARLFGDDLAEAELPDAALPDAGESEGWGPSRGAGDACPRDEDEEPGSARPPPAA